MGAVDQTLLSKLGFSDPDKKDPKHDLACQYLVETAVANSLMNKFFQKNFDRPITSCFLRERNVIHKHVTSELEVGLEKPISKGERQYKTTIGFMDAMICRRISEQEHGIDIKSVTGRIKRIVPRSLDAIKFCTSAEYFWIADNDVPIFEKELSNNYNNSWLFERFHREVFQIKQVGENFTACVKDENAALSRIFILKDQTAIWHRSSRLFDQKKRDEKAYIEVKISDPGLGSILRQINLYREYLLHRDLGYEEKKWILAAYYSPIQAYVTALNDNGIEFVRLGANFDKWCADRKSQSGCVTEEI